MSTSENAPKYPTADLEQVALACEPGEPLEPGDPRYADFTELRQGVGLARLQNDLRSPAKGCQHRCLSGHRGSGKSTEMLRLEQWARGQGFLPLYTEVDEQYGLIELEASDLFLLAAMSVEQGMAHNGKPLSQELLRDVVRWFAEVVQED